MNRIKKTLNPIHNKHKKKRLDLLLCERKLVESRNKAQAVILAHQVIVSDTITGQPVPNHILKPGSVFPENIHIQIKLLCPYVSRGGTKLESALKYWEVNVSDKTCLDIGSSTGGFSDCLLQYGAKKIYAVDVGRGQMHPKLRNDPRVQLEEETHVLMWNPPWKIDRIQNEIPSFITVDVSFLSLKKILSRIPELFNLKLKIQFEILALIKPQLEVGPQFLKKGIVRDPEIRAQCIIEILEYSKNLHYTLIDHFPSPILGMKGNQEEWVYLKFIK